MTTLIEINKIEQLINASPFSVPPRPTPLRFTTTSRLNTSFAEVSFRVDKSF
jgi:hypothetical protein